MVAITSGLSSRSSLRPSPPLSRFLVGGAFRGVGGLSLFNMQITSNQVPIATYKKSYSGVFACVESTLCGILDTEA